MKYDLATLAKRQRNIRRSVVTFPVITAPRLYATDLYVSAYRPIVNLWSAATEQIITEYERSLSELTQDNAEDVQTILDRVEQTAVSLALTLTPVVRGWALKVETYIRDRWAGAVLSATGVRLDTMLGPDDVRATLQTYIAWNVDLIKDVSAQAKQRISNAVFSGLQNRKPAREVAKQTREAVAMSRRRSVAIASDQLSKVSNSLAQERARDAGLDIFEWVHSGKVHYRPEHLARNHKLYSENRTNVGKHVGGKIIHPAPPQSTRAGMEPYCGCNERFILVLDFDEDKGT